MGDLDDRYSMREEGEAMRALLRRIDAERLRVRVNETEYDVPIPVGRKLEWLEAALKILSAVDEKTFIGKEDLAAGVRRCALEALSRDYK